MGAGVAPLPLDTVGAGVGETVGEGVESSLVVGAVVSSSEQLLEDFEDLHDFDDFVDFGLLLDLLDLLAL